MRITADTQLLEVDPGGVAEVVVEVVNTGQVIDGVTARVIGLPEETVHAQPALLPLFPDTTGRLTLSLAVPASHPAGRHPLTVEVMSHGSQEPSQFLDLNLDVAARPAMNVAPRPRAARARRQARFVLEVSNQGNLPLEVSLRALDADRAVQTTFAPATLRMEAGAVVPVLLTVRGPRMLFGAEIDRTVTVEANAVRADQLADPDTEADTQAARETTVRLRQRPQISRGLLTALILAGIVALWAGVFLLGLSKVFANDPMTKAAPASFFAASAGGGGSGEHGLVGVISSTGGAAPAGALPKNGQVPPGVGGVITGTVTATSNHKPVGRILVQALRTGRDGLTLVSSAATQVDGSYTLAGLFPTEYLVRFSAVGYQTIWYPAAPTQSGARLVGAVAQGSTDGINAVITGNPATISGTVDPGDTRTPVSTTVMARPLEGAGSAAPLATAVTAADGSYTLHALPAPGTYELSFTATGYQPTTIVDTVAGGQQRLEPTVALSVGSGQISGTVTDGTSPLGGVTVTTTVRGKPLAVTTPTTGTVGVFVLGNLPTPATYVITFARAGYGTQTTVVDLGAGQSRTGLSATLASGTGSVSGTLTGSDGRGLGGATVTVGGATSTGGAPATGTADGAGGPGGSTSDPAVPTTTTLTQGAVGTYTVNGLSAPGAYTLTFTLAGYAPATVPVTLAANGPPAVVNATLSTQLGRISGTVRAAPGATITATDGKQTWTSASTGSGTSSSSYLLDALQPGTYTVTVSASGSAPQTALVTVVAGRTTRQNFRPS